MMLLSNVTSCSARKFLLKKILDNYFKVNVDGVHLSLNFDQMMHQSMDHLAAPITTELTGWL